MNKSCHFSAPFYKMEIVFITLEILESVTVFRETRISIQYQMPAHGVHQAVFMELSHRNFYFRILYY